MDIYEIREILRTNIDKIKPVVTVEKNWISENDWRFSGLDASRAALLELNKISTLREHIAPALHNPLLANGDVTTKIETEAKALTKGTPFATLHTMCTVLLSTLDFLPPREPLTIIVQKPEPVTIVARTTPKTKPSKGPKKDPQKGLL